MARITSSRVIQGGGSPRYSRRQAIRKSWVAAPCRAAISTSSWLISRLNGEAVMRDPSGVLGTDEVFALLAQTGQGSAHTVHLPPGEPDQVTDRGTLRPRQQSDNRGLLRWSHWCGGWARRGCDALGPHDPKLG